MTMIEQVARAIAPKAWCTYGLIGTDKLSNEMRRTASLRHARAAFAAAREPTEEMEMAGRRAIDGYITATIDSRTGDCTLRLLPGAIEAAWRAMIDASERPKDAPT